MPHTVILAGGGTGGHVYPALAMGDALRARGHRVLYYGDAGRLEGRVAPERGYAFTPVEAVQFPRAGAFARLAFAWKLLVAVARARVPLRRDGATLVLGVGGYVMAPTVLAAWTLGIPAAVHEANVAPGLANRLCARVARLVLLTYAETAANLKTHAEVRTVGCPVNRRLLGGDGARYGLDPGRPTVLLVGGSLGAQRLNDLGVALARHPDRAFNLLHVCGPRYHAELAATYGPLPEGVRLIAYEDRMGDAYAAADLVVCRAGSSTLAELCALGKPSVLVPSPNVTDDHQTANARGLERAGAARVLVEKDMDLGRAAAEISTLVADAAALSTMSAGARALARLDTADEVARMVEERFTAA
jgi:UDP-N-acetylglucosamine--N-acetylmuramyl-(pentapeptide) pyrophosphoryl-undecaprenol N-acetylglucosamine transferase